MQLKFIVSHEGLELGPYAEGEIRQMLATNQLMPIDYLYDETKQDWVLINERFDLKSQMAPMSPTVDGAEAPPPQDIVVRRKETSKFSVANSSPLGFGTPLSPAPLSPVEKPLAAAEILQPAPLPMAQRTVVTQTVNDTSRVQFAGGVGTVSLKQLRAGRIVLKLKDCTSPNVALPTETVVNVQAGPAKMIGWEIPSDAKAGEDVVIHCWAKDAYDNTTTNFQGHLEITVKGFASERLKASFVGGIASVKLRWTKAEIVNIEMVDINALNIGLPAPRTMAVKPGPATKLIVESPAQSMVGENLPVTVKAVDAFGNLATDFKGEIAVGISVETPTSKAG